MLFQNSPFTTEHHRLTHIPVPIPYRVMYRYRRKKKLPVLVKRGEGMLDSNPG
jgi:hypothetical protein